MSSKFHKKSFDKGTKTKLGFFNRYFQESFPVFIHGKGWEKILIYDFFAGKGKDSNGEYGTSLGILEALSCHCSEIRAKGKEVFVILNHCCPVKKCLSSTRKGKISQLVLLQYHIRYAEFAVGDKVL